MLTSSSVSLSRDLWARVFQGLPVRDKAHAAQTCRGLRVARADTWNVDDYWHAATGGAAERRHPWQVQHAALPARPTSAAWRTLAQEVRRLRQRHGSEAGRGAEAEVAHDPARALALLVLAPPPPIDRRVERWRLLAQALRSTGRAMEAVEIERQRDDYLALERALQAGDGATAERLLTHDVPVPPVYPLSPGVIPALARALEKHGDAGAHHLARVFHASDEATAEAILEQPNFARFPNLPAYIVPGVLGHANLRRLGLVVAKCSPEQADAIIAAVSASMAQEQPMWLSWADGVETLLALWAARSTPVQQLAEHVTAYNDRLLWRSIGEKTLRTLSQHGADLNALIPGVLSRYADGSAACCSLILRTLGILGARITQERYDAILATHSDPSKRAKLEGARHALVAGGALPSTGAWGPARRMWASRQCGAIINPPNPVQYRWGDRAVQA